MATTKFKGTDVELLGNEVNVGDKAPAITRLEMAGSSENLVSSSVWVRYKKTTKKEPSVSAAILWMM